MTAILPLLLHTGLEEQGGGYCDTCWQPLFNLLYTEYIGYKQILFNLNM